jgi:small-conductance mechanosensitive channel
VIAPMVLFTIELFHPARFTANPGMYQYLSHPGQYHGDFQALAFPGVDWWFTLHMIQTPMVGLVAIGLWLLAGRVDDGDGVPAWAFAWLSRIATFVFLIYYTALDAIGGFGLGRTIINTESLKAAGKLTDEQQKGVELVLNTTWVDPWVGGVGSFISLTGSWAIFVASVLLALALLLAKKAPWPALILLVAFGWELQTSHTMPYGPIAFSLLIAAAVWIAIAGRGVSEAPSLSRPAPSGSA